MPGRIREFSAGLGSGELFTALRLMMPRERGRGKRGYPAGDKTIRPGPPWNRFWYPAPRSTGVGISLVPKEKSGVPSEVPTIFAMGGPLESDGLQTCSGPATLLPCQVFQRNVSEFDPSRGSFQPAEIITFGKQRSAFFWGQPAPGLSSENKRLYTNTVVVKIPTSCFRLLHIHELARSPSPWETFGRRRLFCEPIFEAPSTALNRSRHLFEFASTEKIGALGPWHETLDSANASNSQPPARISKQPFRARKRRIATFEKQQVGNRMLRKNPPNGRPRLECQRVPYDRDGRQRTGRRWDCPSFSLDCSHAFRISRPSRTIKMQALWTRASQRNSPGTEGQFAWVICGVPELKTAGPPSGINDSKVSMGDVKSTPFSHRPFHTDSGINDVLFPGLFAPRRPARSQAMKSLPAIEIWPPPTPYILIRPILF